jgi:hypothetical protein
MTGRSDAARGIRSPVLHALIPRLPAAGLLPNDPALIQRLVVGMRQPAR